jgi:spore coat polysaccharide biosynthesis protein SpsF
MEAGGKPLLGHLIARLKKVPSLNAIVLATTVNPTDDVLQDFAEKEGVLCWRGSEDDVLLRVIGAAALADAELVVEITGDCPLIDPDIVEQTIQMHLANGAAYTSNAHIRSYPDGMDVQVFSLETLKRSAAMTTERLDREHVTLHIRNNPGVFPAVHLVAPPSQHWPELGLTLDEQADYLLLKKIIEHFGPDNPDYSCLDIIRLLRANPDWLKINQEVQRKNNS